MDLAASVGPVPLLLTLRCGLGLLLFVAFFSRRSRPWPSLGSFPLSPGCCFCLLCCLAGYFAVLSWPFCFPCLLRAALFGGRRSVLAVVAWSWWVVAGWLVLFASLGLLCLGAFVWGWRLLVACWCWWFGCGCWRLLVGGLVCRVVLGFASSA